MAAGKRFAGGWLQGIAGGALRGLWVVLFALFGVAAAHAESFDRLDFTAPPGARSTGADFLAFTDATPTIFAVYGLHRSLPGSGDPARDFAEEWRALVAAKLRVTGELRSETSDWPGGWKLTLGAAKVWSEESRNFVVLLAVFSGHGLKQSATVRYNDDSLRPKIDAFLASLRPQAPAAAVASQPPPRAQPAGAPALTAHDWSRAVANYSHWGTHFNAAQIAAIGSQGYAKWRYRFQPDGSYTFSSEFWSMNRNTEYWFVEEAGTFVQRADVLELRPQRAERVLRDRAGRAQAAAVALPLEPMRYRYRFEYLSGMGKWYLVLMPETGADTRRDGTRSDLPEHGLAYRYGAP